MRANRQSIILVSLWVGLGATGADRIGIDDFRKLHARGAVFAVDVRGVEAYKAGHIPGAVNVPLDQVARRAGEIRVQAKGRAIVTYCSCPEEHASLAAVRLLAEKGVVNARALVGGYPAWASKKEDGGAGFSSARLGAGSRPGRAEARPSA
jgi:rhodanese-related sulfurtransferase